MSVNVDRVERTRHSNRPLTYVHCGATTLRLRDEDSFALYEQLHKVWNAIALEQDV